jgi:hypothetical protein
LLLSLTPCGPSSVSVSFPCPTLKSVPVVIMFVTRPVKSSRYLGFHGHLRPLRGSPAALMLPFCNQVTPGGSSTTYA